MAQCLFHLDFMEKRGSGFRRIQGWMEAAGLDRHRLREADGYLATRNWPIRKVMERLRVHPDQREKIQQVLRFHPFS